LKVKISRLSILKTKTHIYILKYQEDLKIFLATANKHKIDEISDIFSGIENIKILSINNGIEIPEVIEDGETFEENSKKKAVERELQQYKLEILQDKYHLDEDVKYVLTDILVKFKAKLQATAVKIDNEINDISEADRLDYLKNTLIDCLEESQEFLDLQILHHCIFLW